MTPIDLQLQLHLLLTEALITVDEIEFAIPSFSCNEMPCPYGFPNEWYLLEALLILIPKSHKDHILYIVHKYTLIFFLAVPPSIYLQCFFINMQVCT